MKKLPIKLISFSILFSTFLSGCGGGGVNNTNPVAADDIATAIENQEAVLQPLLNDTDGDGDALSITIASATSGSVVINTDGTLTYLGNLNFNGTDSLTYTITDGKGGTDSANINIDVTPTGSFSSGITDLATDSFQQVWVDIEKITAISVTTGIHHLLTTTPPGAFDLLSLRDISSVFDTIILPVDTYIDIEIHLRDNSAIEMLTNNDLMQTRDFINPAGNRLLLPNEAIIIDDTQPNSFIIDLDVDAWEQILSANTPIDPLLLSIKKSTTVKPIEVEITGTLILSPLSIQAPHQLYSLTIPVELSNITLIEGSSYEVEGVLVGTDILVSEVESTIESDFTMEEVKVKGVINDIEIDLLGSITAIEIIPTKSSKMFDTRTVRVLLNSTTTTEFSRGTINDLAIGSKVKVRGQLTLDNYVDAFKVAISGAPHGTSSDAAYFKEEVLISCNSSTELCAFDPTSIFSTTHTLSISNHTKIDSSTKRCLASGEFINAKVTGVISSSNEITVREIEAEQRCDEDRSLLSGLLQNYSAASCVANDVVTSFDDTIQGINGKIKIIAYSIADPLNGITTFVPVIDSDIKIKIDDDTGIIKIKTDDADALNLTLDFLGLMTSDIGAAGVITFNDTVNIYSDISAAVANPTLLPIETLTLLPKNGFIEITNSMGSKVLARSKSKEHHYKPVSCTLEVLGASGTTTTIYTNEKTKWYGDTGLLATDSELQAVHHTDTSGDIIVNSISFTTEEVLSTDDIITIRQKISGLDNDEDELPPAFKYRDDESEDDDRDEYLEREDEKDYRESNLDDLTVDELLSIISDDIEDILEILATSTNLDSITILTPGVQEELDEVIRHINKELEYYNQPETIPTDLQDLLNTLLNPEAFLDLIKSQYTSLIDSLTLMAFDDYAFIEYDPLTGLVTNGTVVIDFLANDILPTDFSIKEIELDGIGAIALITNNGEYTIQYTFPGNVIVDPNQEVEIEYELYANGQESEGEIEILFIPKPSNTPPVANHDAATTTVDTQVSINALANDTDAELDLLVIIEASALNGTVSFFMDGPIIYTPNLGFVGQDIITYTIEDGKGGTAIGTVLVDISIPPTNQPPIANDDSFTVIEGGSVLLDMLANDTDADGVLTIDRVIPGDMLNLTLVTDFSNGTVNDLTRMYTPNINFIGTDTAIYTITDADGATSNQATVIIIVSASNSNPLANPDTASSIDGSVVIIDVLANDTDADSDVLIVTSATTIYGAVIVGIDSTLTYTPPVAFIGQDTITYTIEDGNGGTAIGTVVVDVVTT